jgi:hypothetical protein
MLKLLIILYSTVALSSTDFNSGEEIRAVDFNTKSTYLNNYVQERSSENLSLLVFSQGDIISADAINLYFNQFGIYDTINSLKDFSNGDRILSIDIEGNFQEAKRIVEEKFFFKSCLEVLNNGYSVGNGLYTVDVDGFSGSKSPITVNCDMTNGGWTVIIPNTGSSSEILTYMSQFSNTSSLQSTFYYNSSYGVGWGTNNDTWVNYSINNISYTEIEMTYSGFYENPAGGLGQMVLSNGSTLVSLADSWTDYRFGQTLYVRPSNVLYQSRTNVINRTSYFSENSSLIDISMKGYTSSYGYTRRYIKYLRIK